MEEDSSVFDRRF